MSITLEAFGLDRLTPDEQISLAEQLWARANAEAPPFSRLTDAQRKELIRRADEADADPDGGIPWEQVKAEGRALFKS